MPTDGLDQMATGDGILLGAVGAPDRISLSQCDIQHHRSHDPSLRRYSQRPFQAS